MSVAPAPPMWRSPGHFRALRQDPLGWVRARQAEFGSVWALRAPPGLGPRSYVFATGPDSVRDALTRPEILVKRSPVYNEMAAALGNGLLTSEGEEWLAQRRTIQPLFTKRRVGTYGDAFVAAASSVGATWADGQQLDLNRQMQVVSLRSVSVTLFGTDATDEVEPIVTATDFLSAHTVRRGLAPFRLPLALPTPTHRRIAAAGADLEARTDRIVARGRAEGEGRNDLVALLMSARDPETGLGLSDVEVREQALVLLLAGYDTTSTALTFALHLLGQHPEIQEAVRAEVREVLGDEPVTTEHAGALAAVRRVLDEALRLYPSAYITSRLAVEDTTIGGFDTPAGTVVATSFYGLHRNPEVWADPERFDPDRFLPEAVKERDAYAYLPFGGGPRMCVGVHFALLEATLVLATLLRDWRFEAISGEVPLTLGITLRPSEPVLGRVSRAA